ncbi:hypothetical protein NY08_2254 [Rhodococcus sp. B7740]|nr:hypothetical protein NY08_2254 [Rhodococcus sp. B7740]
MSLALIGVKILGVCGDTPSVYREPPGPQHCSRDAEKTTRPTFTEIENISLTESALGLIAANRSQ